MVFFLLERCGTILTITLAQKMNPGNKDSPKLCFLLTDSKMLLALENIGLLVTVQSINSECKVQLAVIQQKSNWKVTVDL